MTELPITELPIIKPPTIDPPPPESCEEYFDWLMDKLRSMINTWRLRGQSAGHESRSKGYLSAADELETLLDNVEGR